MVAEQKQVQVEPAAQTTCVSGDLLRLQRQHGNRYVQQVLAKATRSEAQTKKGGAAPDSNRSAAGFVPASTWADIGLSQFLRVGESTTAVQKVASDWQISGKDPDADRFPMKIFFELGKSDLDAQEQAKISSIATPPGRLLSLNGFAKRKVQQLQMQPPQLPASTGSMRHLRRAGIRACGPRCPSRLQAQDASTIGACVR